MSKFVIEGESPGAGRLSAGELQAISRRSCGVLQRRGPQIQWVHSDVTDDTISCLYNAPDDQAARDHASRGGFPVDRASRVAAIIDPTTAQ